MIGIKSRVSLAIIFTSSLPYIAHAELEEVIVTAQKREQNLQDVPMAITALSRELLENNEINTIQDLTKLVPSLRLTTKDDPSNSSVRVRGVGTDVYSGAVEPNVSVVVDEVPLARNELASFEFSDLERIEVLRGPQGTLFGKNSTAGLVHIISRDPAPEFEASARLSYEQPDNFPGSLAKVQVSGSGPIADKLGLRVSAFFKDDQGIYEDIEQNNTGPNTSVFGARMKLRWDASDDLMAKLSIDYQEQDGEATPIAFKSANPNKTEKTPDVEYGDENRKVRTFGDNQSDMINMGASFLLSWDFGAVTFTSISGVRKFELVRSTGIPDFEGDRIDVEKSGGFRKLETLTQGFRLTSNDSETLEYTVGALLFNNKVDELIHGIVSDIPADIVARGVVRDFPVLIFPEVPGDSFSQSQKWYNKVEVMNIGLYGETTWHISDDLHLTTRARYIDEEMTASADRHDTLSSDAGVPLTDSRTVIPDTSFSDSTVIGTASLSYDWSEDTIVYGTVSTGYRGGAYDLNATNINVAFENPVDPETAFNTELGFKSRLFDNKVEMNIALFRTVFSDFQAQILKLGSASGQVAALSSSQLANAGEMEAKGVEIDFQAKPFDSLFLYGSLLYSENQFNEFTTQCFVGQEPGESGGVDEDDNGTCDSQDLAGATLPHSPKVSVSIGGRYELEFGDDKAYVGIMGRWQDDVQFNTEQHPNTIQEAYSIWNTRLGWVDSGRHLEIAAYVNNLFAQNYRVNMVPLSVVYDRRDVSHFLTRDADRSFGVSMSYDF